MIGVSARKELGCDEETDTGCGSSGLALPRVQARNTAEVACHRPWPVRSLVPDANPAAARLAIAGVYHNTENHLTAARIPTRRAVQRRHNNGQEAVADFLARAAGIAAAVLADRRKLPGGGQKRFGQKQPYGHRQGRRRAASAACTTCLTTSGEDPFSISDSTPNDQNARAFRSSAAA